jgi:hypothetical protein
LKLRFGNASALTHEIRGDAADTPRPDLIVRTRWPGFGTLSECPCRLANGDDRCVEILGRKKSADRIAAFACRPNQADAAIDAKLSRGVVSGHRFEIRPNLLGTFLRSRPRESPHPRSIQHFLPS